MSSQNRTMFLEAPILERTLTSLIMHSSNLGVVRSEALGMTFTAQVVVSRSFDARKTCPQFPVPIQSRRRQFSIFLAMGIWNDQGLSAMVQKDVNKIIKFHMATWYGKSSNKQLDTLIERKARFRELFQSIEFMNELKAYNTKLLDYFTSNPSLFEDIVEFLTKPPSPHDSDERKYKFPLMAVEMVETETTCILNTFFKEIAAGSKTTFFEALFGVLEGNQILPLLAGYFFRVNLCLMNNRQKEIVELLYSLPHLLPKLVEHAEHMSIANTIQLFLNLDINKHQSTENEARVQIKVDMVNRIIRKIEQEFKTKSPRSCIIIENLCVILCETIEKYYLIVDGKQMMDVITSDKTISLLMSLVRSQQLDYAFPAFNFFISLINYYSFSSFNVDDTTTEAGKKSLERLETQPMIMELTAYFPVALEKIMRASSMNLYLYRLLEILCHCISISSLKIFDCIKKANFFGCLINLMFKHENNNILHMLIEKSFLHVFISDRKIYLEYKKHLFCEIDVIEITAGAFEKMIGAENMFQEGRKKPYFGHFMRILKIYSGIQTVEESIVGVIKTKSDLWNKIVKYLITPYESVNEKKLGSYENVPEPQHQHFQVDGAVKSSAKSLRASTIEQIKKQENVPPPRTGLEPTKMPDLIHEDRIQDPLERTLHEADRKSEQQSLTYRPKQNHPMSNSSVVDYRSDEKQLKKSESFKDFMTKKRAEAGRDLKMQRSLSQEKRLSGQKMKITNPSPSKKNSWKQSKGEEEKEEKRSITPTKQNNPKIPLSRKPLAQSTVIERSSTAYEEESARSTRSLANMAELKKIKVYQIQKPVQKKYRKVEDRDKVLLDFLGLTV